MKTMKENNFLKEFRNYKQAILEALKDPAITPYFLYCPETNIYYVTKFFSKKAINHFTNSIIIL